MLCADPFLWQSHRGFHLLFHSTYTKGQGGLAYSTDALDWVVVSGTYGTKSSSPYDTNVSYIGGEQIRLKDVQRPQLLFVNGTLEYLVNGGSRTGMFAHSFTLFRRPQQKNKQPE